MTQATEVITAPEPGQLSYVPVKVGHPRWNVAVTIGIIVLILALALIAAERLASPY
jgi:hypothetical protein